MVLAIILIALFSFAAGFVVCFKLMERHGYTLATGYGEIKAYGHPLKQWKPWSRAVNN